MTAETDHLALRVFMACVVSLALVLSVHVTVESGPKSDSDPGLANHHRVTYRGGLVTPPLPKPRFTLTDTAGVPFDFRRQTEGYVTLLFFGYARCPDQCPLHLANIAVGLKKVPTALADQVKVIFVTAWARARAARSKAGAKSSALRTPRDSSDRLAARDAFLVA